MRALWLVNQLWVIVPVNPWKNRVSPELLCNSNRTQISMGYRLLSHFGCYQNIGRIRKPLARGSWFTNSSRILPTFRVVYQHITLVVYCFSKWQNNRFCSPRSISSRFVPLKVVLTFNKLSLKIDRRTCNRKNTSCISRRNVWVSQIKIKCHQVDWMKSFVLKVSIFSGELWFKKKTTSAVILTHFSVLS